MGRLKFVLSSSYEAHQFFIYIIVYEKSQSGHSHDYLKRRCAAIRKTSNHKYSFYLPEVTLRETPGRFLPFIEYSRILRMLNTVQSIIDEVCPVPAGKFTDSIGINDIQSSRFHYADVDVHVTGVLLELGIIL